MNIDDIKKVRDDIKRLQEENAKKISDLFHQGVKNLFKECPDLKQISWTQYTPYFNDGDECVFGSQHGYCDLTGYTEYGDEEDDDEKMPQPSDETYDKVREFMSFFNDEDMRDLFGNHVSVTITENSVEVDDYTDHD